MLALEGTKAGGIVRMLVHGYDEDRIPRCCIIIVGMSNNGYCAPECRLLVTSCRAG